MRRAVPVLWWCFTLGCNLIVLIQLTFVSWLCAAIKDIPEQDDRGLQTEVRRDTRLIQPVRDSVLKIKGAYACPLLSYFFLDGNQ